jgi:putative component of membrane protein insertase Oxa1/YidC/SpoIIIJ protein YidD
MTSQQYFALRLIDLYQQRISPNKGFVCAHNALHHEGGCSGFGKAAVAGYGVIKGIGLIAVRLAECAASATILQTSSLDPGSGRGEGGRWPEHSPDYSEATASSECLKGVGIEVLANSASCCLVAVC